jgi:hypothetical protein
MLNLLHGKHFLKNKQSTMFEPKSELTTHVSTKPDIVKPSLGAEFLAYISHRSRL